MKHCGRKTTLTKLYNDHPNDVAVVISSQGHNDPVWYLHYKPPYSVNRTPSESVFPNYVLPGPPRQVKRLIHGGGPLTGTATVYQPLPRLKVSWTLVANTLTPMRTTASKWSRAFAETPP